MLSSVVNSRPKPREAIGCYAHSSLLLHATVSPSTAALMDLPAKCCKQKTYGIANSFRCNTYKKQGGGAPSPLGVSTLPPSAALFQAPAHRSFFLRLPLSRLDATIWCSMIPADTQLSTANRPRVGIPWRTSQEERDGTRNKLDFYFRAVRKAGAEPQEVSLEQSPEQLRRQLAELDAFVLPGSPADVDPSRYCASRHPKTITLDPKRDKMDEAILAHAFDSGKPVLAICYGCQILNVHLKGTLIQDIPEVRPGRPNAVPHGTTDLAVGAKSGDQSRDAAITPGTLLAKLSGSSAAHINSSHHQAIDQPGEKLRVAAQSPDGIIEAVEWTGDSNWIVGVQWHPERMPDDPFAQRLFQDFVSAAKRAHAAVAHKT
jgi:putative glutamine amidotransferase